MGTYQLILGWEGQECACALLCGWIEIRTTLNRPTLERHLSWGGVKVTVHRPDSDPEMSVAGP